MHAGVDRVLKIIEYNKLNIIVTSLSEPNDETNKYLLEQRDALASKQASRQAGNAVAARVPLYQSQTKPALARYLSVRMI